MSKLGEQAFETFYALYEAEIAEAERHLAQIQHEVNTSSHAMESRYDTFREEGQNLAGGQKISIAQRRGILGILDRIKTTGITETEIVQSCALVTLEDLEDETERRYFVIPGGSGKKIDIERNTFTCVSPNAPVGKAMMGKEVGDEVTLTLQKVKRVFEIVDIQ